MKEPKVKKEKTINEWSQEVWNPLTGCTKISSGCQFCYAEKDAIRHRDLLKTPKYRNGFDLTLHEEVLDKPNHWIKPRRIFVNSMSDLFHEDVPFEFILRTFEIMHNNPQHLYMVLTKRADILEKLSPKLPWIDSIWMGVTVEDAKYKGRIDSLRNCGAKNKFISAEPLLNDLGTVNLDGIDWVFCGGESGKNCRAMEEDWVLKLRDQCQDQDTIFTFKQWGGVNRKKNGALLQGVNYGDMPKVMMQ